MQVNKVNSHFDNHESSHKVTHGIHDHHGMGEKTGKMSSTASNSSAAKQINSKVTGDGLGIWRTFTTGIKSLWGHVWGSSTGGVNQVGLDSGDAIGEAQLMAQIGEPDAAEKHGPAIAAAASVAQSSMTKENPYFTTVEDKGAAKGSFMQKVRIRFRELTNQLKKNFAGRFGGRMAGAYSGRGTLNSGQQKPQEDLRKHSRYREDGIEMDCVLTDDSYLMDSYDRKGGYSTLTTKK